MTNFLDQLEGGFLHGKEQERMLIKRIGRSKGIIDISSASTMHLFEQVAGEKILSANSKSPRTLLKHLTAYPYLVPREFRLESQFIKFLKKWLSILADREEILVFNGIYSSYRTILLAQPGKYVFVPEYIHQTHKAAFSAANKKVVEIPILPNKLLDMDFLEKQLQLHGANTAAVYIYHARPARLTPDYYRSLARLLKQHEVLGIVDLDVIYANHQKNVNPALSLAITELRKQSIFLFNLTKEIGAPGLRIGFGLAPKAIAAVIKKFQQVSLEMIPPLNKYLAEQALKKANLKTAKKILNGRINTLVRELQNMGFRIELPPSGINLFLHVPESFAKSRHVLPDHLFTYYVLTRAKVLLRPASNHGHRLNHYVRFVVCQSESTLRKALHRMKAAGICADMKMPDTLESEYRDFMKGAV